MKGWIARKDGWTDRDGWMEKTLQLRETSVVTLSPVVKMPFKIT